jgi:hypothetical protein
MAAITDGVVEKLSDEIMYVFSLGVRRGVSKGVEDDLTAISGVARPQGVEGLVIEGPGETLGSPWPLHAIRL